MQNDFLQQFIKDMYANLNVDMQMGGKPEGASG